jgi:hypothetical protein
MRGPGLPEKPLLAKQAINGNEPGWIVEQLVVRAGWPEPGRLGQHEHAVVSRQLDAELALDSIEVV